MEYRQLQPALWLLRLLLLLLVTFHAVLAYPTGAGGCAGGGSVGGPHVSSTSIITGSLDDIGATVYFGAVDKLVAGVTTSFTTNDEHTIVVTSDSKSFRGLLFRLTSGDASFDPRGSLTVSPDLPVLEQISQVCFDEGIAGVTHLNNTDKTVTEAVLRTNEVIDSLTLEITLVVSNRIINGAFVSEYYYSSYQLTSYDPDATSAPTDFKFPTLSPTASPAPTPQPTLAEPTPRPTLSLAATFPPTLPPVTLTPTITASPTVSPEPSLAPVVPSDSAATIAMSVSLATVAALLLGVTLIL